MEYTSLKVKQFDFGNEPESVNYVRVTPQGQGKSGPQPPILLN